MYGLFSEERLIPTAKPLNIKGVPTQDLTQPQPKNNQRSASGVNTRRLAISTKSRPLFTA